MGPLITEREIREIIRNRKDAVFVETDKVDFPEFLTIMASRIRKGGDEREDMIRAVRVFKKDANGFIKTSEIRNVLTQVGEKLSDSEIEELITDLDANHDGLIKYDEFVRALLTS
ncbi:uncharacterized protein [Ptychodera flava]|uniref:uncharacterized protein n=1 Tax=Ptychodera flava TaxID=63121 RepID=UPI00396A4F46